MKIGISIWKKIRLSLGTALNKISCFLERFNIFLRIRESLMAQIAVYFLFALFVGVFVTAASLNMSVHVEKKTEISYKKGYEDILENSRKLYNTALESKSFDELKKLIRTPHFISGFMNVPQVYITDAIGNVLVRSDAATAQKINFNTIGNRISNDDILDKTQPQEIFRVFKMDPLKHGDQFLIYIASPKEHQIYKSRIVNESGIFPYLNGLVSFIFIFTMLTRKKFKIMTDISNALLDISKGDLDCDIGEKGHDELALIAENINYMRRALKKEKQAQKQLENTKNQLITNVSHDLRTPLTSILGYLGLLREKRFRNEKELLEYVDIAYKKSEELQVLIDDLFEYTKLTSESVTLRKKNVSMRELIEQIVSEYAPVIESNNLDVKLNIPQKDLTVSVDPTLIVRLCENLIMNCVKYSIKPATITIGLEQRGGSDIFVFFENPCSEVEQSDLENIFERFFKKDNARSSSGSGLGLAISKSIVKAHGGLIGASLKENSLSVWFSLPR